MWKNNTFTVTARCEMQKKAEILFHLVPAEMRHTMMDFPFKPREQNVMELFFHYYCSPT